MDTVIIANTTTVYIDIHIHMRLYVAIWQQKKSNGSIVAKDDDCVRPPTNEHDACKVFDYGNDSFVAA